MHLITPYVIWAVPVFGLTTNSRAFRNTASLPGALPVVRRATCGEKATRVCYGTGAGTAQNISTDDISYAPGYLRYLADNNADPLWTMPPEFSCSEWTIPINGAGTVLALAKHIAPRTNSSVTYHDLARTIDGGDGATDAQKAASLLGACGGNGGQMGVTVDPSDPAYNTPGYISSKAKHQDIIVKLVRAPGS